MIISAIGVFSVDAVSMGEKTVNTIENTEENTQPATTESGSTEPTTVPQITPEPVDTFSAQSIKTNSVVLEWSVSDNATEYVIYRAEEKSDGSMSDFKQYTTTTSNSLKDSGLEQAGRYKYKIYAYRVADGYTACSTAKTISVMTKPEPVSEVKLSDKKLSSMKLSWSKNSKAGKYIIYRSKEKSNGTFGKFKKLKEIKSNKKSFVDKKLSPGTIYKYEVKVQRKKGGLLSVSSGKSTKGMTKLNAPTQFENKKSTPQSVELVWSKVKRAEKYEIYRGKKLIKTTKKTSYTDKKLKSGTEYKYSVRAVRTYNHKKYRSTLVKLKTETTVKVYTVADGLSGTWVEVSISTQTMRMYVNNKLYVSTSVVTGNYGALSTTRGHHRVISKKSPARLRGSYNGSSWDVNVNYWLGFTSYGQGIHDSTWRSAYGGSIYMGDGSHGCVNTPLSAMSKIYAKAYIGMPVIVY